MYLCLKLFIDTRHHLPWAQTTDAGENMGPEDKPVLSGLAGLNMQTIDAGGHLEPADERGP
jgi:hypothetical protein